MSVLLMPTRQDAPSYTFEMDLENNTYGFAFAWNERDAAWYFDIFDAVGTPLLSSRKVTLGLPLLWRFRDSRLPPGELTVVDTGGQDQEAGLADLGTRVQMLYYPSTELPASFVLGI